jgi:hypothetical protein
MARQLRIEYPGAIYHVMNRGDRRERNAFQGWKLKPENNMNLTSNKARTAPFRAGISSVTNGVLTVGAGNNGFYNCPAVGGNAVSTGSNPFVTAGNNGFYIAASSPFHNAGTTNIDPALLAEIQTMTTYAPQDGGWADTNGTDLGYHYPEDSDGDGVPDWWAWLYWGQVDITDTNLDYSGNNNTFAQDYSNSIVPTVFSFTGLEVANNYVSSMNTPVQLDVSGSPYYVAMLVDDDNFSNAVWNTYSGSSVTVNLGSVQGWHDVWIGLRGHADDTNNAVWQWKRLKLDFTPPALVITGPTNGTVSVPLIQLTGYSPEALGSISYDLSNVSGTMTNQQVLVEGQDYGTNNYEFTTNHFQAYDVPLTNGLNVITLHAMDLAGNMTTISTNIICTGNTNPPAVALLWPQDGMSVSGSNITIQGQVDDVTATVSVSTVDAGGNTNSFNGLTGRDGVFWVENVPLNAGTNTLAITLSNAAGSTTTNISLVQAGAGLTVNPVAAGDTMVYGTIGVSNYTIWVNGVQATNNGDSTWSAQITPLCVGGGLVVVAAIPDSDNGGNGSGGGAGINPQSAQSLNTQATVQPPQGVFVSARHSTYDYQMNDPEMILHLENPSYHGSFDWENGHGGGQSAFGNFEDYVYYPDSSGIIWPATIWPQDLPEGVQTFIAVNDDPSQYDPPQTNITIGGVDAPELPLNHQDTYATGYTSDHLGHYTDRETGDTEVRLATGGPLGSKQMNLWCISASATGYTNDAQGNPVGFGIPPIQIQIGGLGNLDTNGNLYVVLPDNDPPVVTPTVLGMSILRWPMPTATKHPLAITANGITLSNDVVVAGADFCVGQGINFDIIGLPSGCQDAVVKWTLPGNFVNTTNSDPNCNLFCEEDSDLLGLVLSRDKKLSTLCWYVSGSQNATAKVDGNVFYASGKAIPLPSITGKFNVHRPATAKATPYQPDGTPTVMVVGQVLTLGNGRDRDMSFQHTITADAFCAGQAGYVQLIRGSYTEPVLGNLVEIGGVNPDTELDNRYGEFPRGQPSIPANTSTNVGFYDGPFIALHQGNANEDLELSTYLMFKPSGGIWVPLRLVTWTLDDEADNYLYFNGNPVAAPNDNNCTTFPDWKNKWTP